MVKLEGYTLGEALGEYVPTPHRTVPHPVLYHAGGAVLVARLFPVCECPSGPLRLAPVRQRENGRTVVFLTQAVLQGCLCGVPPWAQKRCPGAESRCQVADA